MLGALISGGLGLLGGILGNQSREDIAVQSSAMSAKQADRNRKFMANQAQIGREFENKQAIRQMQFQERMAGTTYQRAVKDMMAADLNPMLAYSQGGAPSPAGASGDASVPSGSQGQVYMPNYESPILTGLASASALYDVANKAAVVQNTEADTDKKKAEAAERRSQEKLNVWEQNKIESYLNDVLPYEIGIKVNQIITANLTQKEIVQKIEKLTYEVNMSRSEAAKLWMSLEKAYNEYAAEKSPFKREVSPYLDDAHKISSSASEIIRSVTGFRGVSGAVDAAKKWGSRTRPVRRDWLND